MLPLLAQLDWLEPLTTPSGMRIMLVGALTNVACSLVGCYTLSKVTLPFNSVLRVSCVCTFVGTVDAFALLPSLFAVISTLQWSPLLHDQVDFTFR